MSGKRCKYCFNKMKDYKNGKSCNHCGSYFVYSKLQGRVFGWLWGNKKRSIFWDIKNIYLRILRNLTKN